MSCPTIIAPVETSLPTCLPNLMPFHLNYSGPAPIATYFRVKPATFHDKSRDRTFHSAEDAGIEVEQPESQADTFVMSQQTTPVASDVIMDSVTTTSPSTQFNSTSTDQAPNFAENLKRGKLSLGSRFVAAFRGRTIHGVTVDLPEGYGGCILRPEGGDNLSGGGERVPIERRVPGSSGKGTARAKTGRVTRNNESHMNIDGNAEAEVHPESSHDLGDTDQEGGQVRVLNPSATFLSFVLWNPDLPVDEANDEYMRSLSEWTTLAAQVSFVGRLSLIPPY